MVFAEIIWWFSLGVILIYHLFVFRKKGQHVSATGNTHDPGVSVLIAVKNGSKAILQHLEDFCQQDYPHFEILIVDDHSSQEEKNQLIEGVKGNNKVRLIHSELKPGKKQALTFGIQAAKHEYILCTDADCWPTTSRWIRDMIKQSEGRSMVLGYSPYEMKPGLLNRLIRFETVMTGIQYLSWATIGKPYMGVGRNLLYHKQAFLDEGPYIEQSIPYGDDDLWVQKAATNSQVKVCYKKTSHVKSIPEISWKGWLSQKHRHLSAGHQYETKAWLQPGAYAAALIFHWLFFLLFFPMGINLWVMGFFVLGLLFRWQTHSQWTKILGDHDTNFWFPILELGYALYLAMMGLYTMVRKKKAWT